MDPNEPRGKTSASKIKIEKIEVFWNRIFILYEGLKNAPYKKEYKICCTLKTWLLTPPWQGKRGGGVNTRIIYSVFDKVIVIDYYIQLSKFLLYRERLGILSLRPRPWGRPSCSTGTISASTSPSTATVRCSPTVLKNSFFYRSFLPQV